MDSHLEYYLSSISDTLYRIANSLEELIELNKPKQPEAKPTESDNDPTTQMSLQPKTY